MTESPEGAGVPAGEESAPAGIPAVPEKTDTPHTHSPELQTWFLNDEPPKNGIPQRAESTRKVPRFEDRQYFLAVMLIVLYAAGNACLAIGWFMGVKEIATMAAIVGNIGTLVAAVVAFYFAEPKTRK